MHRDTVFTIFDSTSDLVEADRDVCCEPRPESLPVGAEDGFIAGVLNAVTRLQPVVLVEDHLSGQREGEEDIDGRKGRHVGRERSDELIDDAAWCVNNR